MAKLNITNFNDEEKEMLDGDRKLTGQSQREYVEYLVRAEHEKLKDDVYLLKRIKGEC